MWLTKLKELKAAKGLSTKQIAEKTKLPERTVTRLFSGETDSPYVDTLHRIVVALGGSLDDILADANVVVSTQTLAEVQENTASIIAERDQLLEEAAILKAKLDVLTREHDFLKMKLAHKEELLAVHNHYNKIKSKN